jgi:hypothetical protein
LVEESMPLGAEAVAASLVYSESDWHVAGCMVGHNKLSKCFYSLTN